MYVAEPKSFDQLLNAVTPGRFAELRSLAPFDDPRHLHWDKLRHLKAPAGMTAEEWWVLLKINRSAGKRTLPIIDTDWNAGYFVITGEVSRLLHHIDRDCGGSIAMPEQVLSNEQARSHYLVNSLMEESIRSSQIEGAATTRQVAKEMLRTGRAPANRDERMVSNNFLAMRFIDDLVGEDLTVEHVIELQRILTTGTLDDEADAGRIQRPQDERVVVGSKLDDTVLHTPPPAEELPKRMAAMCRFANEKNTGAEFVHPVIRAIVLHFWLAYDHPFADGNGRTARALFYWKMRNEGYWLIEYLSISKTIRSAVGQYARAFLHTETDDFDLTYFILHQLQVIERAAAEFFDYVERKVAEVHRVDDLLRAGDFNYRQRALLGAAIRDSHTVFSFRSHATSHGVTHETARRDITELERLGFLQRRPGQRQLHFVAAADLTKRLKS